MSNLTDAARALGSIRTARKSAAAARNGALGGRPKKVEQHVSRKAISVKKAAPVKNGLKKKRKPPVKK